MTVEKIAWLVGMSFGGQMWESQADWAKKILGKTRSSRISAARNITALVLYETCETSYTEIAGIFDRHTSQIARYLARARAWRNANPDRWLTLRNSVQDSLAAEQQAHAKAENLKVAVDT